MDVAASMGCVAWQPSEVAWKARTFVNLLAGARIQATDSVRGIVRDAARAKVVVRDIVCAAGRKLQEADLPHVAEALVRKFAPDDSVGRNWVAVALVDRFADARVSLGRSAALVAGLLRGLDEEAVACTYVEFMARRVVLRHLAQDHKAFGSGQFVDVNGLLDGLTALATGVGGAQATADRLKSLLAGFAQALGAGAAAVAERRCIEPDDQALAIGVVCDALGGPGMPAELRRTVLAFLCEPSHGWSTAARAAMAYQLGAAVELWRAPAAVQGELLAAVGGQPGLSQADVGAMAWAFGTHLLGVDPDEVDWHEFGCDMVVASGAPPDELVEAVTRLAEQLPEESRRRVAEGMAAASRLRAAAEKVRKAREDGAMADRAETSEAPEASPVSRRSPTADTSPMPELRLRSEPSPASELSPSSEVSEVSGVPDAPDVPGVPDGTGDAR